MRLLSSVKEMAEGTSAACAARATPMASASDPAHSRRQAAYVRSLGRDASYMPQIVVDGAHHVVGSRESAVRGALAAAASRP